MAGALIQMHSVDRSVVPFNWVALTGALALSFFFFFLFCYLGHNTLAHLDNSMLAFPTDLIPAYILPLASKPKSSCLLQRKIIGSRISDYVTV
ncbi:uncharacterized protein BO72DRAFT_275830 [Aspergillus fijiensis CBS 313.89]|uniref:Uncharacterized protein n=1 Tax=Aspergillus fijiensis CBS 313.89 TaxID=1448319 RepID=A0A8G1RFQ1_9EURO|nr:uncharacterized protein BO72DRAFT_275830 [Aspergillus fijiensis CBS 313.89]RAK72414.1 hypothetical protein BO72DRAFT_275830 [Aspergillus fijiensis CBS 313.89]